VHNIALNVLHLLSHVLSRNLRIRSDHDPPGTLAHPYREIGATD
jgi:hypothetical protein